MCFKIMNPALKTRQISQKVIRSLQMPLISFYLFCQCIKTIALYIIDSVKLSVKIVITDNEVEIAFL